MKNKIGFMFLACVLIAGGFFGISKYLQVHEPLNVETISDGVKEANYKTSDVSNSKDDEKKNDNEVEAKAAVLMDADSGKVLMEQNSHKKLPPASVTKVMTMLIALENVKSGKVKLTDEVEISENAASMGGSQMYMEAGEKHKMEELMKGIAMVSANDACVAVAEYIAGSIEKFVSMMNSRAKELGMKNTNFQNTNGLPVTNHYTSAYDIALMSKELLKFDKARKWFSTWQDTVTIGLPGKEKEFGLTNTNKLIKQYDGAIGIKTGFTEAAGYCLSGAAKKGDTTLIAVVLGCKTSEIRFNQIKSLFDYGFSNFVTKVIQKKNKLIKTIDIPKGEVEKLKLVTDQDVKITYSKNDTPNITKKIKLNNKEIVFPIKAGKEFGKLYLQKGNEIVGEYKLIAEKNINKASLWQFYIRSVKKLACN